MAKIIDLRERGYTGPKCWRVVYTVRGQTFRPHFKTEEEAEEFKGIIEAEQLKARHEGRAPEWFYTPKAKRLTVKQIYGLYKKNRLSRIKKQGARESTEKNLKGLVEKFGRRPAMSLRGKDFDDYLSDWLAKGNKLTSFHTCASKFKTMLNWAAKKGHLPRNPLAETEIENGESKEVLPLTKDEANIFEMATQDRPELRQYYLLGIATGMRLGELWSLEWKDMEKTPFGWKITIPREKAKTKYSARTFDLDPSVNGVIEECMEKRGHTRWILHHYNTYRQIENWTAEVSEKYLHRRISPHVWRHTYCTWAMTGEEFEGKDGEVHYETMDIRTIAEITGHEPDGKTLVRLYYKVPRRKKAACMRVVTSGIRAFKREEVHQTGTETAAVRPELSLPKESS